YENRKGPIFNDLPFDSSRKSKRKYLSPYGGFRGVSRSKMNSIARRRVKLNVKTGGSLKLAEA
ncbi:MAG: hypothetical protein QF791_05015, partial [Nitrospinaceae bacterium]|nr:hypothetical protein [Nitrospinaceae bacterium]